MKKLLVIFLAVFLLTACAHTDKPDGDGWYMGFGSAEISVPDGGDLYIAGFHNGKKISGVSDTPCANAVWADVGTGGGMLLIGIDCIALSGETVSQIRTLLSDLCRESGCTSVNIFATHDHASIDSLGLWGEVAIDGKDPAWMDSLKQAAVTAATAAYRDRRCGTLFYGSIPTEGILSDTRPPVEYDPALHQFRFVPDSGDGIRMVIYGAHAEAMGGDNRLVSRDYPGVLSDEIRARTGDRVLFLPGAIGGQIVPAARNSAADRDNIGKKLADYALSVDESREIRLTPHLLLTSVDFSVPLDNTLFLYYRFLGILGNRVRDGNKGYELQTTLSVLSLGEKTLALLPGEIFPELVSGNHLKEDDPEALASIAARYGIDGLIPVGLVNDEIGYILPPSDYLIDETLPYIREGVGQDGRKHYEETNSVGRSAAYSVAAAFEKALRK